MYKASIPYTTNLNETKGSGGLINTAINQATDMFEKKLESDFVCSILRTIFTV
jgi:hypothetical protein